MASQSNEDAPVGTGMRFDIPEPGATGPWNPSFLSCSFWARPLKALMALCNLRVSFSTTTSTEPSGRLSLAEDNAVLELSIPAGGGSGTGNLNYRGLYSSGTDYAVNDCVYTAPDSNTRHFWVCEIANNHTSPQAPTWPEPGTVYWRRVEQFTSATKEMYLKTVAGDHLECCELTDPGLVGTITYVAKQERNRQSITSETIGGVSISYGYSTLSGYADKQRKASATGASDQYELLIPPYKTVAVGGSAEIITIAPISAVALDGVSCTWIEVNPRKWCQIG